MKREDADASTSLAALRDRIARFELAWRREHLPPPSRTRPLPDPDAVRVARTLEACGRRLDRIGGRLRSRSSGPRNDEALASHLLFLVELTARDEALAEPDRLMDSLQHLEQLADES